MRHQNMPRQDVELEENKIISNNYLLLLRYFVNGTSSSIYES